jgi:hypothetical protein
MAIGLIDRDGGIGADGMIVISKNKTESSGYQSKNKKNNGDSQGLSDSSQSHTSGSGGGTNQKYYTESATTTTVTQSQTSESRILQKRSRISNRKRPQKRTREQKLQEENDKFSGATSEPWTQQTDLQTEKTEKASEASSPWKASYNTTDVRGTKGTKSTRQLQKRQSIDAIAEWQYRDGKRPPQYYDQHYFAHFNGTTEAAPSSSDIPVDIPPKHEGTRLSPSSEVKELLYTHFGGKLKMIHATADDYSLDAIWREHTPAFHADTNFTSTADPGGIWAAHQG